MGRVRGRIANAHGVSFGGEENLPKLDPGDACMAL